MKKFKNEGITLIALVVTIVVLLILAGVSISMLTGENGIITQAQNSKNETIIGEEKDAISLAYSSCKIENMMSLVTDSQLQEQLTTEGNSVTVTSDNTDLIVIFTETNHKYVLIQEGQQSGKIEQIENLSPEEAAKIIDIVAYTGGNIYVLTAGGEVKTVDVITGNQFNKIEANNENIITKNGVRKKQENCFIDNKGKVYTWGSNYDGQLGNGTTTDSSDIICISDIENNILHGKDITDIYSNGSGIIARDSNGKVYTWGDNYNGKLGNGTTDDSNVPICISDIEGSALNGKNITNIFSHNIVKDSEGKIYTWGSNSSGQIGNGTTEHSSVPICISDIEWSVLNGRNITNVFLNGSTVVVTDSDGKVYTWGDNYNGKLGNGTTEEFSNEPICISDISDNKLYGKNIIDICSNGYTVIARDSDGKVYTWGNNDYGQLGSGMIGGYSSEPIALSDITGNALNGKIITDIKTTSKYECFIVARDSEGKIYTWGNDKDGQLGYGEMKELWEEPKCISDINGSILNGKNIVDIYIDGYTVIVRDSEGKIYTWGNNDNGQLGNGTRERSCTPTCISDIDGHELKNEKVLQFEKKRNTELIYYITENEVYIYTWILEPE